MIKIVFFLIIVLLPCLILTHIIISTTTTTTNDKYPDVVSEPVTLSPHDQAIYDLLSNPLGRDMGV